MLSFALNSVYPNVADCECQLLLHGHRLELVMGTGKRQLLMVPCWMLYTSDTLPTHQAWRYVCAVYVLLWLQINAFALWNVGRVIEGELGSKAFTAVYLGSAVAGNLTSQLLGSPFMSSLGASGVLQYTHKGTRA